jgi:excinuclease ABC subunit C
MSPELESKLKDLPDSPGIYQFKNEMGKTIYVGKALNLKNRVRSYFHGSIDSPKTMALVSKIKDLELIVTDSEIEALVLENNLIKELKPKYNVNLKDDKSFPYIKVTNETFPRIFPTRRIIKDGSKYFGPYTEVRNMKASLRMINQIFRIRGCKLNITSDSIEKKKFKVCLDFHIGKCDGPCEGLISSKDYSDMVAEVVKLLRGKTDDLIQELNVKMHNLVDNLEFEKAAEIRDKLEQLKAISAKQKIVSEDFEDRDVITTVYEGRDSACSIFIIRNGKLVGKKQLHMSIELNEDIEVINTSAIKFYYNELVEVPNEILLETLPNDEEVLADWLYQKGGHKVRFKIPKRGNLKSLVNMCKQNALYQLKEIQIHKMKHEGQVPYPVAALQRDLRLKKLPKTIECFDISNLQGTDTVASMVSFEEGKPKKSLYRKFIIKSVDGPDDFQSIREVIYRRYSKLKEERVSLPDLIMVDGGKGQLSSAIKVLDEMGFSKYDIIGLAKRLEEVFFPGNSEPESIPKTSSGLKLLQQIRNEAHRFAITFHRNRRSKRTIRTDLTDIKGIGPSTAKILLKELGSLAAVRNADEDTLKKLIGKKKTDILIEHFSEHNLTEAKA